MKLRFGPHTVATPLDWPELGRSELSPRRYAIGNLQRRMAQKADPLADFFRHKRRPPGISPR